MAARWLLYLITLTASFLLYVFHTQYISWLLFIMVVFVPILSCLMTLPLLPRYSISLKWSAHCVRENQKAFLAVFTGQAFPVSGMRIKVQIKNLYFEDTVVRDVIMRPGQETIPAIYDAGRRCGLISAEIKKARVPDFLGLFLLPVSCKPSVELLVLPPEIPFDGAMLQVKALGHMDALDLDEARLRGGGDREHKDVREYREGDSLRDIHWKLTARHDKFVVREYEPDGSQAAAIKIGACESRDGFRICLGRFLGLAAFLREQGQPYYIADGESPGGIIWQEDGQYVQLRAMLSAPPLPAECEEELCLEKTHRLMFKVSPENVVLYVDGYQREVFQ